jgi:hypothetical protein
MEESSPLMTSKHSTERLGLRGSSLLPTIPSRMVWQERKNRTIMEAVKAMIHDQDLPMQLWAEATRTVVYVQTKHLTVYLGTRHQKKCLQEKIQKSAT